MTTDMPSVDAASCTQEAPLALILRDKQLSFICYTYK